MKPTNPQGTEGRSGDAQLIRIPGLNRRIELSHAIILGALIIALGTFVTNNLHDLKENRDREETARRIRVCRHWEEAARVAAFAEAEIFTRKNPDLIDRRSNPEYWVAVGRVRRSYPADPFASDEQVVRPPHC